MPQDKKPWEENYSQSGGRPSAVLTDETQPFKLPSAAADLAAKRQEAQLRDLAIAKARKDLATTPDADVSPDVLASIAAGKPVRLQDLPPGARGIVSGLLQGNLPAGQRSIASKSMLPYIKMAMSVDPSFSANTFAARQKATSQLADMKATGGYLTSLGANIDHSREEEAAINKLGNPGGWFGRLGGAALNNLIFNSNGPAGAQFEQANRVYSGEQVKSITGNVGTAGGGSALQDRQEAENAITASMPYDAQIAALRTGAMQNYQKFRDANLGYRRTMGTDIPDAMTPEQAQQLLHLMRLKDDGTEGPIPAGTDPGFIALAMGPGGITPGPGGPGSPGSGGGDMSLGPDGGGPVVGSGFKTVPNPQGQQFVKTYTGMIAGGVPDDRVLEYATNIYGAGSPALRDVRNALQARREGKKINFIPQEGLLSRNVPDDRGVIGSIADAMVNSPTAVGIGEAGNAAAAGIPQWLAGKASGNADLTRLKFDTAASQNPKAALTGQLTGGALGALGAEGLAARGISKLPFVYTGLNAADRAAAIAPWAAQIGDALFGGLSGATSDAENPSWGALKGMAGGWAGGQLGRSVGRSLEFSTRAPSRLLPNSPAAPSAIDRTITRAVGGNLGDIQGSLSEAGGFNLPMTLADTNPNLRSLAGASVRRSPTASGIAENVLLPRSRGQIDRFQSAIERDLGPTTNVPQLTDDMMNAARTKAGPLYEQAYAAPPITSPKIDAILKTPFGKQALGRAMTIARNERVDPNTLSVTFDAAGDPVMAPTPSTRTLDYVKRGMDDVLEGYRDRTTGRVNLDEMGRAQLGVKNDLLSEMDRLNPAYGQARATFAGPAQEADWIRRGGQALNQPPDSLAFNAQRVAPGKLPFMQLGYRDALSQAGNKVGYGSNPFDRTLGSPAAESRLNTMYPDSPGPPNLLRQRDLERTMQATSTDVLGNSKTAQRGIADEAFAGENLPQLGLDVGLNLLSGQVPIGTMMKANLGRRIADAYTLGVGKRATVKADALAPILLNPDPAASSTELANTFARSQAYRDWIARRRGLFGAPVGAVGSGAATGLLNQ